MDTPQVETDDRRAILEQGFDAAEKGEPIPSVARDEAGRFAPKPQEAAPVDPPADPPVWERPPASWKKDYHEQWGTIDPKVREYVWQREEQMRKGVEPLLTKAQFADAMNQAIEPYRETIRGLGIPEHEAVAALMKADYTLRTTADPAARAAYFQQLAQAYGVNLGGSQNAPQAAQGIDPVVWQLQNELNKVRGEVMGWKQQQEMVENQALLGEIESFSQKAEHFEDARPTMIQLLQSGMAQTLDEAYEKAIRLDSALFERVNSARQAEAQAKAAQDANRAAKVARAAAVSVRSATPGTNTAPKAANRRAMLEEALAETESRL